MVLEIIENWGRVRASGKSEARLVWSGSSTKNHIPQLDKARGQQEGNAWSPKRNKSEKLGTTKGTELELMLVFAPPSIHIVI